MSLVALHNSYFYIFGGLGKNSLTEVIDTTSPAGRMTMQLVGTFAKFEREYYVNAHKSVLTRLVSKVV